MKDSNQKSSGPPETPEGGNTNPPGPVNRSVFSWLLVIAVALVAFMILSQQRNAADAVTWGVFMNHVRNDNLSEVIVQEEAIIGVIRKSVGDKGEVSNPPASGRIIFRVGPAEKEACFKELNEADPMILKSDPGSGKLVEILLSWLPMLLIFALIWFFLFRGLRNAAGGGGMLGNFGRSRHKIISKEMTSVVLTDVAGVEEAKEEVGEIVEFLKNPKKFQRLGGRIPRGVLLIGPPGCGKTLLAKAVAGEAEVPFFSISGSDFVEMFVGVGASRVRDLFKQAKDSSPCIIFLDEIDAVGRRRGSGFGSSGGHDEREQTLNAILVEMDGFETSDQVIVIAATNRADVLDPALTRPGRFDRQIEVQLPDLQGRVQILRVHAKKVKMGPDIDLERLGRGTPMFSGADLAAIINEAAIIATLAGKDYVEQADLEEARDKVRFGRAYKSRKIDEDDRIGTAYHEAGHAALQQLLEDADPLHKVTIIPRGHALGATMSLPERDRYGHGMKWLHDTMRVLCGGRIAQERKTTNVDSGASMDIRMVTRYARHMILEWGMSEKLGFVDYASSDHAESPIPDKNYSDETAHTIDEEVRRLIDEAYADAERLIAEHWDKVVAIAEALLKYETLSADDVDKLMKGQSLSKPTISDLLNAEAVKSSKESTSSPKVEEDPGPEPGPGAMPSPA